MRALMQVHSLISLRLVLTAFHPHGTAIDMPGSCAKDNSELQQHCEHIKTQQSQNSRPQYSQPM